MNNIIDRSVLKCQRKPWVRAYEVVKNILYSGWSKKKNSVILLLKKITKSLSFMCIGVVPHFKFLPKFIVFCKQALPLQAVLLFIRDSIIFLIQKLLVWYSSKANFRCDNGLWTLRLESYSCLSHTIYTEIIQNFSGLVICEDVGNLLIRYPESMLDGLTPDPRHMNKKIFVKPQTNKNCSVFLHCAFKRYFLNND